LKRPAKAVAAGEGGRAVGEIDQSVMNSLRQEEGGGKPGQMAARDHESGNRMQI